MHRVNVKLGIRMRHANLWVLTAIVIATVASTTGACLFGTATNQCEKSDRRCGPGQTCAANQDVCIEIGGCGDGIVNRDKEEVCDDGNTIDGDGCSADCKSDEKCGNGIMDVGETCDDHNTMSGDGCDSNCKVESCGDSIYNPVNGEECDTGVDTQACNGGSAQSLDSTQGVKCKIPRCGDGYPNTAFKPFGAIATEQCDDGVDTSNCNGNNNGMDGIGSCQHPLCGDGYLNKNFKPPGSMLFEMCDEGGDTPNCNGDGNGISSNRNDSKCQPARCGDGYANTKAGEMCDGGDMDTTTCNGSSATMGVQCQPVKCGDNYVNAAAEECDSTDGADSSTCNGSTADAASCHSPRCGDGYVNTKFKPGAGGPEECEMGVPCADASKVCVNCNCI